MLLQRQFTLELDEHLDMTPMVDVVFQLMTFLLLTYHAAGTLDVDIPAARHGIGVEESESTILAVLPPAAPGGRARVYLGKEPEPGRELADDEAIRGAVTDGLTRGQRRVILQAGGSVPHGEIIRIAAAAAEVEGVVLHIGVKEPD